MFGWFKPRRQTVDAALVEGDGSYSFEIVGEASYQDNLAAISGPKGPEAKRHECLAVMLCEDSNAFDKYAVAVQIDTRKVGYLSRSDAVLFRKWLRNQLQAGTPVAVKAIVCGG